MPLSIILFQMVRSNGHSNVTQPLETVIQSVVDISVFWWIVATRKNLTFSNQFMMGLYREGNTSSESNTHYFNITRPASEAETTVIKTITAPASTAVGDPNPANPNPAGPGSGGNSFLTGAAVGAGVGGTFAVVLAITVGWWAFRLWKRDKAARNADQATNVVATHAADNNSPPTAQDWTIHRYSGGGELDNKDFKTQHQLAMPSPQEIRIHETQEIGNHDSRSELGAQPAQFELQ